MFTNLCYYSIFIKNNIWVLDLRVEPVRTNQNEPVISGIKNCQVPKAGIECLIRFILLSPLYSY